MSEQDKGENIKSKASNTLKHAGEKLKTSATNSKVGTMGKTLNKNKKEEPPVDLSLLDASKITIIERKHKNRTYMFAVEEDAQFFDQLVAESATMPWEKLLDKYYTNDCPNKRLDAIVNSLYEDRNPDWIFQLNDPSVVEGPSKVAKLKQKAKIKVKEQSEDQKAIKAHAVHELLKVLLLEELIVVQEELYWFVYTPFDKLCSEAQEMQLRLDLDFDTWKELYEKAKKQATAEILEADKKEKSKGLYSNMKVVARNIGTDVKDDVGKYLNGVMSHFTEVRVQDYGMSAKFIKNKIYDFQGGRKPGSAASDDIAEDKSTLSRTFFKNSQRILITNNVIGKMHIRNYPKPGLKSTLQKLMLDKVISDSMVMHDLNCKEENDKFREGVTKRILHKRWAGLTQMFRVQPYNHIRDYFGEQIALYFAFMGFYMKWLLFPVLFGLISVFVGLGEQANLPEEKRLGGFAIFDNRFTMAYAVLMGLWSTTFLEFWKRRQNFLAFEWKTWECEDVEIERPEWIATKVEFSTMTWKLEKSYPEGWQKFQIASHMLFVFILILIVVFVYVIIFTIKPKIKNLGAGIPIIMGILNMVVITIMTKIYTGISLKFNQMENYKTDTVFQDSLIMKRYVFKFITTYSAILFVGFFKDDALPVIAKDWYGFDYRTEEGGYQAVHCLGFSCFQEMALQLCIVLGVSQLISALTQIILPKIANARIKSKAKKAGDAIKSLDYEDVDETQFTVIQRVKIQQGLSPYEFDEYEVKILQFGFVVLFGAALPIAPVFALIVNLLETRTDAMKIMTEFRRSVPVRAKDLGSWYTILSAVSTLSIVINAFLIGFQTSDFQSISKNDYDDIGKLCNGPDGFEKCGYVVADKYPGYDGSETGFMKIQYEALQKRFIYIIVFEHLVLAAKLLLAAAIPDMPASVANGMGREAYQNEKRLVGSDFEETILSVDDILEVRNNKKMH